VTRFAELLDQFFYRPDEDVSALLNLTSAIDEVPLVSVAEEAAEYLAFELEGEAYIVPIERVREILKVPPLTEVPRSPHSLLGVMNLRGEVLPVYDLKPRLGLRDPPTERTDVSKLKLPRSTRVVLIRDETGDAGVLVDAVRAVVRLRPSTFEPPPLGLTADRDCIVGLGRSKGELFILLDIERALA
jgi:purine-binding chemotaxis protein CheW